MLFEPRTPLILASGSASRAAVLRAAGVPAEIVVPGVDEKAVRAALEKDTAPEDVAEVLARAKAESVSAERPEATVIGADQVLALDGRMYEKPRDMEAARETLLGLSGKTHQLHAAVALARGGDTLWAHGETAHMTMRALAPEFVGRYLAEAGKAVLGSVGAYQLERLGVQLFSNIEGDYFAILGLPLLPLLSRLRQEGVIA